MYPEAAEEAQADHRAVGRLGCGELVVGQALDLNQAGATISAGLRVVLGLVLPALVLGQRAGSRHRVGLELTSS